MKKITRHIIFILIFAVIGFIALQVPFTQIVGSKQHFSFFDFFAPISGGFLGGLYGAISVFLVKVVNLLIHRSDLDWLSIVRLFPIVFGAVYFGTRSKKIAVIPAICIILFILHPEGRQAWYFSLYWLIPIIAVFKKNRLILNSLGSTFTVHAIGSTAFLYALNLKAAVWISLIPVVFLERMIFAVGIWVSFLVVNMILQKINQFVELKGVKILPENIFSWEFFRKRA